MTRPAAHAVASRTGVIATQCTDNGEVETALTDTGGRVRLHVREVSETGTATATLTLEPHEAIDLATDLLMLARAAAWDGDL